MGINNSYLLSYKNGILGFINGMLMPILLAIALLVFVWGVYKYFILGAANEESRKDGRDFVLYGVIGFVIIISVWGLVGIVGTTLGLTPGGNAPPTPTFNTNSGGY